MRLIGRPSKLTEKTKKRLLAALQNGANQDEAARYAGIGESTFYRWMEKGATKKRGQYREFWEAVKRTESEAAMISLDTIRNAEKRGDWRAAAWKLERRFPDKWGKVDRQDVTTEHTGGLKIELVSVPPRPEDQIPDGEEDELEAEEVDEEADENEGD
jgi:transposase